MYSLATHLARRGFEFAQSSAENPNPYPNPFDDGNDRTDPNISRAAMALAIATFLVFAGLIFSIYYSYGFIVGVLTIVEDPRVDEYVAVDGLLSEQQQEQEQDEDGMPKPPTYSAAVEPDVLLIKRQPITSSIRSTILHLRARAGYFSRFRGLFIFIFWGLSRGFIATLLSLMGLRLLPGGFAVATICAEVILAPVELTWYHIVISEPSEKNWWKRIPSFRSSWAKIAPAVAVRSVVSKVTSGLPFMLWHSCGMMSKFNDTNAELTKNDVQQLLAWSLLFVLLTLAFFILLDIPAIVTVVRVAASMLPDENETIVPFDRSFGGKVTPAVVGGAGKIGMLEAWRSFAWSSRVRLMKLVGKVLGMIVATYVALVIVLGVEAQLLIRPVVNQALAAMAEKMNGNGH